MSLNTAHANGGVLIYFNERILLFCDGVEMGFEMPGKSMPHFKGQKKGRIYLTTHRVIFNNKDNKDILQSFSIPFYCMKEVELKQPVFGANYIAGIVNAESGGNWQGLGKWKLWFNSGGAIEFGQAMLQAGRLASNNMRDPPPPYTPPTAPFYQPPPPAYAPPQTAMYAFVPYQTFPSAPPADGVYMSQAPPPYPGIDPSLPAPPGASKAAEAASSAYYSNGNPHDLYIPSGVQFPPSYDEATKKTT